MKKHIILMILVMIVTASCDYLEAADREVKERGWICERDGYGNVSNCKLGPAD